MSSYATRLQLLAHLGTTDDSDASAMQLALDAATGFIDAYTGRSFRAETAVAKRFSPTSAEFIDLVPDLRSATTVKVDDDGDFTFGTTLASTDYYLLPLVPLPDAGIYQRIQIAPSSSQAFAIGMSTQVEITGNWGYVVDGNAPQGIVYACLLQASRLFNRKGAPFGVLENTDLGQFTRIGALDPDVKALLDPYKSRRQSWLMV